MANSAKNKKTEVYEKIKQRIIDGSLTPGLPINETDLATDLNVSKTPVREALRQLEREGLVTTTPGRGSTVSHITFQDIREIFEMREIIECGAAKRAAMICDETEVRHKKKQLETMMGNGADSKSFPWGKEEDIHQYIIRSVGNQKLTETYMSILDHVKRMRIHFGSRFIKQRYEEILKEHIIILDALLAGDADKAEEAVQSHLRNAAAYVMGLTLPKKG